MRLHFTTDQVLIDGRPDLVFGGDFQYFRIKREQWEGALSSFKAAGVNLIAAYVPWIWHELAEGDFDFDGRTAPERDLRGFLYLCRKLELPLILKPGPYIYAEYQGFGIPAWLRERYPHLRMQPPSEPGYPEFFLNHPGFLEHTRRWFTALAPMVSPMVEAGEVVAIQLDNETGMPQYGAGPYLIDKSPEAIDQLRRYLRTEHTDLLTLNARWGTSFGHWDEVEPPAVAPTKREAVDDLAGFVEEMLVTYLGALKGMWHDLGIEPYFYLNDVWMPSWPNHFVKKNKVAPVGFDMYPKFIRVATPLDQPFVPSWVPRMYAAALEGGPLMGAEIGAGWLDEGVKVPVVSTLQKMVVSYLRGSKANILYPLHEGEDPDGSRYVFRSPFSHAGERSTRMEVVDALGKFREDWGTMLATSEPLNSPVGIVHVQEASRDVLELVADPMRVARETLDPAIDKGVTLFPANSGLFGALAEAGYQPQVFELSRASDATLATCKVLFYNSSGKLTPEHVARLETYVTQGGTLVTLGEPFAADSPLFPGKIKRTWRPRSLAVVAGTVTDLAGFHLRDRGKITHPGVRFTIEKLQPVMSMIKHATRAGVWLNDLAHGGKVWCSRFVTYVTPPAGATPLLAYHNAPVGYSLPVGEGTTVFLGTLLGPILDSPGYYLDEEARKQSVMSFLGSLLAGQGVKPLTRPVPGVEPILRRTPTGLILGLVNRGAQRSFAMSLPEGWEIDRITHQFSFLGCRATWTGHLAGNLRAGEVLCLHLAATPPEP